MSYYPTAEEIDQLGFKVATDECGPYLSLPKVSAVSGREGELELVDDEGSALLIEWLGKASDLNNLHGWTTCESYEQLKHVCDTAFDVIAEGR